MIVAYAVMRAVFAVCALSFAATSAFARCVPPDYRKGNVREDSESTLDMTISIPLTEFAPARLVCLAEALRDRYRDRKNISVLIFSSVEAAKYYHGDMDIAETGAPKNAEEARRQDAGWSARQLHGVYSYDAASREEYVTIKPKGYFSDLPTDTQINLPLTATPHCRLELSDRCLLALDDVLYEGQAYKAKIAASVTLTGTITREGSVTGIQVADSKSIPQGSAESLTREAINNLKTWRLEPARRQDPVRVTYSYMIDSSLKAGEVDVRFALPKQVTIRANPTP